MADTTKTRRFAFTHADIVAMTTAFNEGEAKERGLGIKAACAKFPRLTRAEVERKLRSVGALELSDEDRIFIGEIVGAVAARPYSWLVAEKLGSHVAGMIAAHAKESASIQDSPAGDDA
jgi:hypothetical protein